MLSLLRRDPSLRMAPKWILVGALMASAVAGMRAWMIASRTLNAETLSVTPRFIDLLLLVVGLWVPLALFLAFGRTGQRCSRFDLVMPVAAGRLLSAHWLGILVSGTLVLGATVGVLALHDKVLTRLPRYEPGAGQGLGSLTLAAAASMLLVAAILQSTQPSLFRVRIDSRRRWMVVASLVFGLALILGLSALPLAVAMIPVAGAVALAFRTHRAVPPALTIVPATSDETVAPDRKQTWSAKPLATPSTAPGASASWSGGLRLDATVFRILMLGIAPGQMLRIPMSVTAFPFLFGMGMLLGGLITRYDVLRFTNITLTVYMLAAFVGGPMMQLYILDPLPISRRRIFALLMLPNLLAVGLGYGAARLGLTQLEPRPSIAYGTEHSRGLVPEVRSSVGLVRVPNSEFVVAWDGQPPRNTSPWGESHDAWAIPLFHGAQAMIYSPFSTDEDCSVDFVALQISRAVEAIHGGSIPYEEIRDRYLDTSPDGAVVLKQGAELSLLRDYPKLEAGSEGPVFPVVMMLTALLWFPLASIYFRIQRASTSDGARKGAFFGMLGLAIAVHIAPFVLFMTGVVEDWVAVGMLELAIRWLVHNLPGGSLSVWLLSAVLFAAAYRFALGAFERIEVTRLQLCQDG